MERKRKRRTREPVNGGGSRGDRTGKESPGSNGERKPRKNREEGWVAGAPLIPPSLPRNRGARRPWRHRRGIQWNLSGGRTAGGKHLSGTHNRAGGVTHTGRIKSFANVKDVYTLTREYARSVTGGSAAAVVGRGMDRARGD